MSLFLLIVAFVFTGLNLVSNKALVEMGLGAYAALYTLGFWGSGVFLSLGLYAIRRHPVHRQDAILGLAMGAVGGLSLITLLLALDTVSGFIAFPFRSCSNVALTAASAYVLWRERVTRTQWAGIACALMAIYLLLPGS